MATLREADWDAARNAAFGMVRRLSPESIPVADADGRILASDTQARCDVPSFASSAMDGWAVCGPSPWRVLGESRAGRLSSITLSPGTCLRISTGAVVPRGTSAVVRWEDATLNEGYVSAPSMEGRDIRPAGEECRRGEIIARAGESVTPAVIGLLAATGHDDVSVVRRPRVSLVLLGDELQVAGIPQGGRVRDSLGPQLPGWLTRAGGTVVGRSQVTDECDRVAQVLRLEAEAADVIITTGGTSNGVHDHLHPAIASLDGDIIIDRVAVKPGHPMLLARIRRSDGHTVPVVGLPGNPLSAVVGLMTLGIPVLDAMLSRSSSPLPRIPTAEELRSPAGHTRLIAGVVRDGRFQLSPYGGSAMLRGLARSRGFAVVPAGTTPAGADVRWLRLP